MKRTAIVLAVVLGFFTVGMRRTEAQSADAARSSVRVVAPADSTGAEQEPVPHLVQFTATLKDAAGRAVAGVASVTFAIYAEQEGGTPLWSETQNVLADGSGHFSVLLGAASSAGVPVELFGTGQSRWLGVTVARQPEMPRVLLASVPYALKAGDAQTLGGLPASAYVTNESLAARNATPSSTTILAPGGATNAASAAETSAQANAATAPTAISNATPTGSGTADFIPLWTSTSALGNSLLFQTGGNVGINTKTPAETLDVNGNSIFRGSFQLPPGHDATASSGYESHSFQFQASSFNSSTGKSTTQSFGFRTEPLNNNTANPSAQLDLFFIPNGGSTFINTGLSFAANGVITFSPNQQFTGTQASFDNIDLRPVAGSPEPAITLGGSPFIGVGDGSDTYFGISAGAVSIMGSGDNVGIGNLTLQGVLGSENVAVGYAALQTITGGGGNTAVGFGALSGGNLGSGNTAVGYKAGSLSDEEGGSDDTMIGEYASVAPNVVGSTAIGHNAEATTDNALILGGTGIYGVNVGIGTTAPISNLDIESSVQGSIPAPNPVATLTNNVGGIGTTVALDFNTYAPNVTNYNPAARLALVDQGNYGDSFVFYTNKPGAQNNGLLQVMSLDTAGNLKVGGSISKASGSFKIDDPIDPGGKYLSHSFVESPDMMNIYNGNVVTDAKGYAVVTLPAWFDALNRDFRYQLTTINSFSRATVAQEIKNGKFQIRTSRPHVKVSWQVTGIRQDAWANAHRVPTEEVKPASEQGHYLHPELFGAGPDKAVGAVSEAKAAPVKSAAVPGAE